MNLIFNQNIFSFSFILSLKPNLEKKFGSLNLVEINDYSNEKENILILPLSLETIPDEILLNNVSIYLPNDLSKKYFSKQRFFYLPDENSYYFMSYSSIIYTNILEITELFQQTSFNPFLFQRDENLDNLCFEIDLKYIKILKPFTKKYFTNFLFKKDDKNLCFNSVDKKIDETEIETGNIGFMPLNNFNYNIYLTNRKLENMELIENEELDFNQNIYLIYQNKLYKISKVYLQEQKINKKFEINQFYDFQKIYDNNEYYFFNQKNEFPKITIFIISIGSSQLKYTLESINKLKREHSFIINFIYKISPTSKAYGLMPKRCHTKYFVQCDEDMILNQNFLNNIFNLLNDNKTFLYISALYDKYLGITDKNFIWGIKTYNNIILNYFKTVDETNAIGTSSVDRYWHQDMLSYGFKIYKNKEIEGVHAFYREPDEIFLKLAKTANNIFYGINKEDDNFRFIKVLNDFKPNFQLLKYLFKKAFNKDINLDEIREVIREILVNSKKYHQKFLDNYFLKMSDINKLLYQFESKEFKMKHEDKINFIAFLGFIYGYFKLYNYNYLLYPHKELSIIKKELGFQKNLLIISSQIPNYGGSGTNALTLKNFINSCFVKTYLLIVDEDEMYDCDEYHFYDKDIIIVKKHYFEKINKEMILELFKLKKIHLVINRNPQSKYLSKFNFKRMFNRRIICFVGGGIRIIENNKLKEFYPYYKEIIKNKNRCLKVIQKPLINSINNCDFIIANSNEIHYILKTVFQEKMLDFCFSSFINKNTSNNIFDFQDFNSKNFNERENDILFICSNLNREVKNFNLFKNICINNPNLKKIVIGKNNPNLQDLNITSYDFIDGDLSDYYLNSKIVINTSFYDSSPSVITDGIYYGCNVLINRNVGNFELFNPICVVNNYNNILEWNQKINNLLIREIKPLRVDERDIKDNLNKFINNLVEKF